MVHCHPSSLCLQEFSVNCLRCKAIFSHLLEVSTQAPSAIIWYVLSSSVHVHAICIIYMHYLPQLTYTTHAIYLYCMHSAYNAYIICNIYIYNAYIIYNVFNLSSDDICIRLHTIRITSRYAATSSAQPGTPSIRQHASAYVSIIYIICNIYMHISPAIYISIMYLICHLMIYASDYIQYA